MIKYLLTAVEIESV